MTSTLVHCLMLIQLPGCYVLLNGLSHVCPFWLRSHLTEEERGSTTQIAQLEERSLSELVRI